MLTKFENKSNRVKGLTFHPKRPWILCSLHNGVIQLWNYQMGTRIDQFEEHDGPVRGICFHQTQPLFVSGGDDYRIKVWNYKLKKCLFTLLGHLDYIRTVEFHHEYPWIVSASDDQTIRIWNWQSRSCISVLTGHNHYVMSASFHHTEDLLVSASLDQTVRVWDITGLRKKNVRGVPNPNDTNSNDSNADLFGNSDTIVKHVLEGHDRGVNWAAFHHTMPLIVSGADDRQVKLWRMNDVKAWEVDTLRGHMNNVSCVIFKPDHDLILSNSEDRSIRVWDTQKRQCIQTFRRENDRFWILATHPTQNVYAAGHDSGMMVFKLYKERPPYVVHENFVYYVKERYLRRLDMRTKKDIPITLLRSQRPGPFEQTNASLEFNPAENMVIVNYQTPELRYELVRIPKGHDDASVSESTPGQAVFVARTRTAVLNPPKTQRDGVAGLAIKNLRNEPSKKCQISGSAVFFAGMGQVLLKKRDDDGVILYDVQQRKILNTVPMQKVKRVVWSPDKQYVALLAKNQLTICDKRLNVLSQLHDSSSLKSAVWTDKGILIYNTSSHIKFALRNGDCGILRTQDEVVYLVKAKSNSHVLVFNRKIEAKMLPVNMIEATFKDALWRKDMERVKHLIKHSRLQGRSILTYLQEKGYPQIAMLFVTDQANRFQLAIECGEIEVAMETVAEMEKSDGKDGKKTQKCWKQLADYAMKVGNTKVAEIAYQRTKNFEKLAFLYLITGQPEKLTKMQQIAKITNDASQNYRIADLRGDYAARSDLLAAAKQEQIAHMIKWKYEREHSVSNKEGYDNLWGYQDRIQNASAFVPPFRRTQFNSHTEKGWPLHERKATELDGVQVDQGPPQESTPVPEEENDAWDDEEDEDVVDEPSEPAVTDPEEDAEWGEDEDLELDFDGDEELEEADATVDTVGKIQRYPKSSQPWAYASCGLLPELVTTLKVNFGVQNFDPLESIILEVQEKGTSKVPLTFFSTMHVPMSDGDLLPYSGELLKRLQMKGAAAIKEIRKGPKQFPGVIESLREIACRALFVNVTSDNYTDIQSLIRKCRNGILLCQMHLHLPKLEDPVDKAIMTYKMTKLDDVPERVMLRLLYKASVLLFKSKNLKTSQESCRRYIEAASASSAKDKEASNIQKARAILVKAQGQQDADEIPQGKFGLCCQSWEPIPHGTPTVKDAFLGGEYLPQYKGEVSKLCGMVRIDPDLMGWQFLKVL